MKTNFVLITLLLFAALLASCSSGARVGALQTESQAVDLGDTQSVDVDINMGAGDLEVTGGAEKLLEANFTYNVARLKPAMEYTGGTLLLRQPGNKGLPDLRGITGFRNEWGLRLNDQVPMDLRVEMGAGTSDLQLAGLSLTGLNITLGAGRSTIDLSGDWTRDLNVTINTGAADLTLRLPKDVGVRLEVERGPMVINAPGLTENGAVYTNDAYGESELTLQIDIQAGIGQINVEVED